MWINTWRVERRTRVNSHLSGLINNFHLNRVQIGRFSQPRLRLGRKIYGRSVWNLRNEFHSNNHKLYINLLD